MTLKFFQTRENVKEVGVDWDQKASAAIGFIKATETLQK
jgi:hypothetical protein